MRALRCTAKNSTEPHLKRRCVDDLLVVSECHSNGIPAKCLQVCEYTGNLSVDAWLVKTCMTAKIACVTYANRGNKWEMPSWQPLQDDHSYTV